MSTPMFSGRRHILAGLQCANWFQIDMQLSNNDACRAQHQKVHDNGLAK